MTTPTVARDRHSTGDLLAAALAHARRGWQVFPLRPGSKQPALHGEDRCPRSGPCRAAHQGWEQRATTDARRIAACWRDGHGQHNIGIACGPSGLVVIDLDTPKDGSIVPPGWAEAGACDGVGVFTCLCQRHGQPWPVATYTVATPTGLHLYFTVAPRLRLRNTAGRLGWCIDTRATGGYVVAPGSIVGGRRYAVVRPAPPARLPTWLVTRLADPARSSLLTGPSRARGVAYPGRYAQAAVDGECQRVARAPLGRRNDTLNRAAFSLGQLTAAGLVPADRVRAELAAAACRAGLDRDPGCGPRGIDRTIRSGLLAGARHPRHRAA